MRSHPSPTAEGFRALVRAPAAFVAELVWRWTFGVAVVVVAIWSLNRFFHGIIVSAADEVSLASGLPPLVSSAFGHIFGQMPNVLLRLGAALLPGMSLMWVFAASAGRMASTARLVEFFGERYRISTSQLVAEEHGAGPGAPRFGSVLMLHFLRVVIGIAAVTGYIGAAVIAGKAARAGGTPSAGVFFLVLMPLEFFLAMIASWLNWIVSLGPVFVVRDGRDWLGAIADSVKLSRTRAASFSSTATLLGILRFVLASSFAFVGLMALGIMGQLPGWAVWSVIAIIYGVYALISDALLTVRLGAYVAIAQQEIAPEPPVPPPAPPPVRVEPPAWLKPLPLGLPGSVAGSE